jgi:hypothetical protein
MPRFNERPSRSQVVFRLALREIQRLDLCRTGHHQRPALVLRHNLFARGDPFLPLAYCRWRTFLRVRVRRVPLTESRVLDNVYHIPLLPALFHLLRVLRVPAEFSTFRNVLTDRRLVAGGSSRTSRGIYGRLALVWRGQTSSRLRGGVLLRPAFWS